MYCGWLPYQGSVAYMGNPERLPYQGSCRPYGRLRGFGRPKRNPSGPGIRPAHLP